MRVGPIFFEAISCRLHKSDTGEDTLPRVKAGESYVPTTFTHNITGAPRIAILNPQEAVRPKTQYFSSIGCPATGRLVGACW